MKSKKKLCLEFVFRLCIIVNRRFGISCQTFLIKFELECVCCEWILIVSEKNFAAIYLLLAKYVCWYYLDKSSLANIYRLVHLIKRNKFHNCWGFKMNTRRFNEIASHFKTIKLFQFWLDIQAADRTALYTNLFAESHRLI